MSSSIAVVLLPMISICVGNMRNDDPSDSQNLHSGELMWPLHATGQSCEVRTIDGWPVGAVSTNGRASSLKKCQEQAVDRSHKYFQVREQTKFRCEVFSSCVAVTKRGHITYFAGNTAKTNSACAGRGNILEVGTPAECERLTTTSTGRPRHHVLREKPDEYMDCWTFSVCDPVGRRISQAWRLFRKPEVLWEVSKCKHLDSATSGSLTVQSDPESLCQERAIKRGHKYFAYSALQQTCATSGICAQSDATTLVVVREEPQELSSSISCIAEDAISRELESIIFTGELGGWRKHGRMPLPTEEKGWGIHDNWVRPLATAVRSIFHDAQDYNRLMLKSNRTNKWERISVESSGEYGGVDGCIYEPVERANCGEWCTKKGAGSPGLTNWNIQRQKVNENPLRIDRTRFQYAIEACRKLCCDASSPLDARDKVALCGRNTCDSNAHVSYESHCVVDMHVFGALLIVQKVDGPKVPMTWGRRQRDCNNIFKSATIPNEFEAARTGLFASSFSSFHETNANVADFALLGFDAKEMTALMGAHSFGKMHKYSGGGLVVRNQGTTFCGDPDKVLPPLSKADMDNASIGKYKGQCRPEESASRGGRGCWHKSGLRLEPSRLGLSASGQEASTKWQDPSFPSFDWGGFWDTTPDRMDNEYFKVLDSSDVNEKRICCGPKSQHGCDTKGVPMQTWDGEYVEGQGCETSWCMRSMGSGGLGNGPPKSRNKADQVMISTRQHVSVNGRSNRLYMLAADWALLENSNARAAVRTFANDENAFHQAFSDAFFKLLQNGWPKVGRNALRKCRQPTTTTTTTTSTSTTSTITICSESCEERFRYCCTAKQKLGAHLRQAFEICSTDVRRGGNWWRKTAKCEDGCSFTPSMLNQGCHSWVPHCNTRDRTRPSKCPDEKLSLPLGQADHDTFRCLSGWCVPLSSRCNGIPNCGDHSDEESCCDDTVEKCTATELLAISSVNFRLGTNSQQEGITSFTTRTLPFLQFFLYVSVSLVCVSK